MHHVLETFRNPRLKNKLMLLIQSVLPGGIIMQNVFFTFYDQFLKEYFL